MKKASIAVIVPSYNEAKTIRFTLRSLDEWRAQDRPNRNVVFVNDGSTDETGKILSASRFDALDSSEDGRNIGKGGAFIRGLRHAHSRFSPDVIVALDADLVRSPVSAINRIVSELHNQKVDMVIAGSRERFRSGEDFSSAVHDISGQRAIRMRALMPLVKGNRTWESALQGYGMEACFNMKIPLKYDSLTTFYASEALKNCTGTLPQARQGCKAIELLSNREALGRLLRSAFVAHSRGDPDYAKIFLSRVDETVKKIRLTGLADQRWERRFYGMLEAKLRRCESRVDDQPLKAIEDLSLV
jgi:glycosyltransferase involved in cell wall biosynthesis